MSDRYNGRGSRGYEYGYDDRPRRPAPSGQRPRSAAPSGSRPAPGSRSSYSGRPSSGSGRGYAPQGQRPRSGGSGSRPPQYRRPAPRGRRRRNNPMPMIVTAIAVIVIIILIVVLSGGRKDPGQVVMATPTPSVNSNISGSNAVSGVIEAQPTDNSFDLTSQPEVTAAPQTDLSLAQQLASEDSTVAALDSSEQVTTKDLKINTALPNSWTNILLLGTDERNLNDNARTDAMLICSINNSTGDIKLTSIMRDAAFKMNVGSKYDGTYRINSANYFGGPEYAMRVVNENLQMNIQYYVTVNFFGFSKIASALGGVELDITEAEKDEINKRTVEQAKAAYYAGVDESDLEASGENVYLETFGPNTHLNGRQTLAYARIRKLDSDASRTERQRKVLTALLGKLKTKSLNEVMQIGTSMFSNVKTNLSLDTILTVAVSVLQNGNFSNLKTLRLPDNNTYKLETRNEQSMLYDVDWNANANTLYNFIYAS